MYLIKNVDVIFIIIKYKYIHTLLSEPVLSYCMIPIFIIFWNFNIILLIDITIIQCINYIFYVIDISNYSSNILVFSILVLKR